MNPMLVDVCTLMMPLVCEALEMGAVARYQDGVPLLVAPNEAGSKINPTNLPESLHGWIQPSAWEKL